MKIDNLGIASYSETDLVNMMYAGHSDKLTQALVDIDVAQIELFNKQAKEHGHAELVPYTAIDMPLDEFDKELQSNWLMPDEYKTLDIVKWIRSVAPDHSRTRVDEELVEFETRNMLDLLRWLKYFVDTCRKNNIVWGVGRGSSVSSYVLFLIGVHRIDSIRFSLDFREFLR